MPRLAIVIGCSTYAVPDSDLPAAGNDARAVAQFLEATTSYGEVFTLIDPASAIEAKQALSEFVQRHRADTVQELVVYFSGHGLFRNDEFYYVFRTYDELRPRETCLENTELDDMLRALSPQLTVKIVDACNSGVSYVKAPTIDHSTLQKHLDATQNKFSKCYFLYSSYKDQSSYADHKLSYFTRALFDSIATHPIGPVRYKDLVSAVADFFAGDPYQRPFFVIQADQTEEFFTLSESLRLLVHNVLNGNDDSSDEVVAPNEISPVLAALRRDAARFVEHEVALARLASMKELLEKQNVPVPLQEMYVIECVARSGKGQHPGAAEVGEWLRSYGADVMAKPTYKFLSEAQTVFDKISQRIPRQYESTDVESYEHTVTMPFAWIEVKARARLPNLHQFKLIVVPLLTRAEVHVFCGIGEYGHKTWTDLKLIRDPTWNNSKADLAPENAIVSLTKSELRRLWDAVAKHAAGVANMKKDEMDEFIRLVRESG